MHEELLMLKIMQERIIKKIVWSEEIKNDNILFQINMYGIKLNIIQ